MLCMLSLYTAVFQPRQQPGSKDHGSNSGDGADHHDPRPNITLRMPPAAFHILTFCIVFTALVSS